ncbi:hypothetical protein GCM10017600_76120 [Streptosporangium carneum]|uniref:SAM-dependent methyltransferase n=1 Tax=Streptosporangium carneum TaxID=47481 RepID=A0A9W6MHI1_9ACTN|nr:hypothetical protein GCM10017600_76120 [Streptosporangium carneum]
MDGRRSPADPSRLNPGVAHNARVWNYWLGGKDHYPADRAFPAQVAQYGAVARKP